MERPGHDVDTEHRPKPCAVPALELVNADGERIVVAPRSLDDRVGDLADALGDPGTSPAAGLWIDGRPVPRSVSLAATGILRGSQVAVVEPGGGRGSAGPFAGDPLAAEPLAIVTCVAGPGAGASVALRAGRHVVGRAHDAPVRVDDELVEPHHGVLDVDLDGSVCFTQLTGRVPCRAGAGRTCANRVGGPVTLRPGDSVFLGASRLIVTGPTPSDVDAGATLAVRPDDPWQLTVVRTPRPLLRWAPAPVTVPAAEATRFRGGGVGLAAALTAAAGTAAMAMLLDQPMFLVLGVAGLLVAGGSWLASRLGSARAGRRAGNRRRRDLEAFATGISRQAEDRLRFHRTTVPTVSDAITVAGPRRAFLWARRPEHGDAFAVSLGWGAVPWPPAVDAGGDGELDADVAPILGRFDTLDDVPVPADLGPGAAMAIVGPSAEHVIRSLVVQLATGTGPADWRLVVLADDTARWQWCRWLPHATVAGETMVVDADHMDGVASALGRVDDGDPRHVVIVTDRPDLLSARTGRLRRFLAAAPSTAVVVQAAAVEEVPATCRCVLELGSMGVGRWTADTTALLPPEQLHVAGVSTAVATHVARGLAPLVDPEDPQAAASSLPAVVSLDALSERHGVGPLDDAIAVAAAWRSAGNDPPPAAVVGLTSDGVVELDLVRDGPHALVAGTTGSGKSELLRSLVVSLAARSSPDHVTFVLIDYKGGATFDACADLPHTVGLVTDLDDRLAERALVSLAAELRRREHLLRERGAVDLDDYRAEPGRPPLPRLVVVVDEFAALAAELPGFLPALVGIAQRGRSLGVHLVLATQRPAGVVSDEIRANTNLRIALRLQDPAEARDIVGDDAPASFPRGTPGRAMMRLGPAETVVFQAARSGGPVAPRRDERLRIVVGDPPADHAGVSELTVLVRSIRHAAALCDIVPPHRPWLPPLPDDLGSTAVEPGAVGILDVPAAQRRDALRWSPAGGNLALIGARGSGTTTALCSVLVAATRDQAADDVHVFVVDASGNDGLEPLGSMAHCGGVVHSHERERLVRMLRSLGAELDRRRRSPPGSRAPIAILAVDGMPALRTALDSVPTAAEFEILARLLAEGPGFGMACVVTAERPGALAASVLAACPERWVFRLDDPSDAVAAGVPVAAVPTSGPGRVVVAASGLDAQIAPLPVAASNSAGGPGVIGVLPEEIDGRQLPAGAVGPDGELELVVGVDFDRLATTRLIVPDGEHVLVAGPARSGRTTALARLMVSWREARPDGDVWFVGRSSRGVSRRSFADGAHCAACVDELDSRFDEPDRPRLFVVDDAEHVDDPHGRLGALVASRRPGVLVVAAGRPEAMRPLYGHWTALVRRSRLGLLLAACAETDGDVLGELLPRHPPLPARPGLAWMVGAGGRSLVQIAV